MKNDPNIFSNFKENVSNISRFYLKMNPRFLELQSRFNRIIIFKLGSKNMWRIHFILLCFDNEKEEVYKTRFKVELNTEELEFMFGIKEIAGKRKDKKMILLSRFVRFENYLGVFIERHNTKEKY